MTHQPDRPGRTTRAPASVPDPAGSTTKSPPQGPATIGNRLPLPQPPRPRSANRRPSVVVVPVNQGLGSRRFGATSLTVRAFFARRTRYAFAAWALTILVPLTPLIVVAAPA